MNDVYLLTGSNLGDRESYLTLARNDISELAGPILSTSGIVESPPWGFMSEHHFLNQVLKVRTTLGPMELLRAIQQIEHKCGRERCSEGYSSRTLDIDILYYNHEIIRSRDLEVPHPHLHTRRFTLLPLVDIAAEYLHPVLLKTNRDLLLSCNDPCAVWHYKA